MIVIHVCKVLNVFLPLFSLKYFLFLKTFYCLRSFFAKSYHQRVVLLLLGLLFCLSISIKLAVQNDVLLDISQSLYAVTLGHVITACLKAFHYKLVSLEVHACM